MEFTNEQIKALDFLKLAKVTYHKNMWKKNHECGYNTPGKPYDMIHIASDLPTDESKSIVLIHEVGHTYFSHVRVNVKKEILTVRSLFKKNKVNYSYIRLLGGPMSFLNICMDFEVNSKLLTFGNLKHMEEHIGKLCVPENFSLDYQENFRDYYEPLIQYLKKRIEEEKQKAKEQQEREQSQEDGDQTDGFGGSGSGMDIDNFEFSDSEGAMDLGDPDDYEGKEDEEDSEDNDGESDSDEDSDGEGSSSGKSSKNKGDKDSEEGDKKEEEKDDSAESFDKDLPKFEDIEDMIRDMAKDLVDNDVSMFDEDFDDEIKKELQEESYDSAEDKVDTTSDKNDIDGESTVAETANELSDEPVFGDSDDSNGRLDLSMEMKSNNSKTIKNFLESIVRVSVSNYRVDYLKHLNRGTRVNSDGILYSSLRNTMNLSQDKMGVLIDVSGSMDTSTILEALKAIKEDARKLSSDSTVVTWAVSKVEEFPLTKIPDYVNVGGGTYMDRGLDYLINVKKCNTILIYSDFETDHDLLMTQAKKFKGNLYSIFVDFDYHNILYNYGNLFNDYIKLNKKVLYLKSKEN